MEHNAPRPWELFLSALISTTILIIILQSPDPFHWFGAFIGLALVFFFPGYALALALFPGKDTIGFNKRLILIITSSFILAALAGFLLNLTPRGVQPASLAFSLSILSLAFTLVAYLRWSALSRRKRFVMEYGIARKTLRNRRQRNEVPGIALVLLGLMLVIAVSAFALSSNHFPIKNGVVDLDILRPAGAYSDGAYSDAEISMVSGIPDTFVAAVKNHENRPVNYTLVLALGKSTLFSKNITLERDQKWQGPVSYSLDDPVGLQKLDLKLYKEENLAKPYRERHILVNVSKTNAIVSPSSNFSGKRSDSIGDEDRFVVLGTVIENYLGNKSGQGSSSSHPNLAGFPKEYDNKKSDKSSIGKAHEEMPDATGQVSAFSDGISESNPRDVNHGHSGTTELSQERRTTTQTAGIHQPDRTIVNALKPAQEFKGDRIQPPQQIATQETGKISLAETQDRVQDSNYDPGNAVSTESNKISAAEGSYSGKQVNAQTAESNTLIVAQRGSILAEKQKESLGTNMDSGFKQASQEIGSKELNAQSISSIAAASKEAYVSEREPSSKKTESLEENKLPDEKPNEMDNEINSWMGTRETSSSDEDKKSYQSKNIQYVKEGSTGKAVLGRKTRSNTVSGSESETPKKLG